MSSCEEIRQHTSEELNVELLRLKKELFQLRNERAASKQNQKPHLIVNLKKRIARIHTILHERELNTQTV